MAAQKKHIDVKTLGAMYLKNTSLTIKDLATEAGVHPHTLKRAFVAAKIAIRHYYPNGKGAAKAKAKPVEKKAAVKAKEPAKAKAKVAAASGSGRRGFIKSR